MKKNYLKIALVSAFAMAAGYNVYSSQKEVNLSEMALANIEAIANDENGGDYEYSDGQPYVSECGVKVGIFQYCKATVISCQGGGKGCNPKGCPQHG